MPAVAIGDLADVQSSTFEAALRRARAALPRRWFLVQKTPTQTGEFLFGEVTITRTGGWACVAWLRNGPASSSATSAPGASTFTYTAKDRFGSGSTTLTLGAGGKTLTGNCSTLNSADGKTYTGAIRGELISPTAAPAAC